MVLWEKSKLENKISQKHNITELSASIDCFTVQKINLIKSLSLQQ